MRLCIVAAVAAVTAAAHGGAQPVGHEFYDPAPYPASVVTFGRARFTVLTANVIRLEESPTGAGNWNGDDRTTAVIVNRALPTPPFAVSHDNASSVTISTDYVTITYVEDASAQRMCSSMQPDTGSDGSTVPTPTWPNGTVTATAADCCTVCGADPYCLVWTFAAGSNGSTCWLFQNEGAAVHSVGTTRGGPPSLFTPSTLRADVHTPLLNTSWTPGPPDAANLLGAFQKTECYNGSASCAEYFATIRGAGVVSRSGYAVIDDTKTFRMVPAPLPRRPGQTALWLDSAQPTSATDWYLFAHGLDYAAAVRDYAAISGAPAMLPRNALGIAWSRWYPYNATSVVQEVLDGYAANALPLNTLILDMDWHVENSQNGCNPWGGYDWNTTLFPDPAAFMSTVKSGNWSSTGNGWPLQLGLNYHASTGVDQCERLYPQVAVLNGIDPSTQQPVVCDYANLTYIMSVFDVYINASLAPVDVAWMDWGGCGVLPLNPRGTAATFHADQFVTLWWGNYVQALLQLLRNARPWNLYRYGGYGQQRYPAGFSGDTYAAWPTLAWEVSAVASSANVGFGVWSFDLGGYMCEDGAGGCDFNTSSPAGAELLLRWLQAGATLPVFRTHCDHCERRVWLFPYASLMRDALLLRAALVPYLLSLIHI